MVDPVKSSQKPQLSTNTGHIFGKKNSRLSNCARSHIYQVVDAGLGHWFQGHTCTVNSRQAPWYETPCGYLRIPSKSVQQCLCPHTFEDALASSKESPAISAASSSDCVLFSWEPSPNLQSAHMAPSCYASRHHMPYHSTTRCGVTLCLSVH